MKNSTYILERCLTSVILSWISINKYSFTNLNINKIISLRIKFAVEIQFNLKWYGCLIKHVNIWVGTKVSFIVFMLKNFKTEIRRGKRKRGGRFYFVRHYQSKNKCNSYWEMDEQLVKRASREIYFLRDSVQPFVESERKTFTFFHCAWYWRRVCGISDKGFRKILKFFT